MLEKIKEAPVFEELNFLFKHGIENVDPNNVAGFFKSRSYAYDHIVNLLSRAENEVIIATTDLGLVRKAEAMKPSFRKLKQAKVPVTIYAPLQTVDAKAAAEEIASYATVKKVSSPSRFTIVDNKDIVFMINDDVELHPSTDVGIWVQSPYFAQTLKTLLSH